MRHSLLAFAFFALTFFASCEGDVRFTTEQPSTTPALKEVPAALQGNYVNGTDSLYVRPATITLVRPSRQVLALADSGKVGLSKRKDGSLFFRTGSDRYVSNVTKDSVTIVNRNAQVYRLGKDTLLKSFNNAYWLSMKNVTTDKKTEWKVMQISLRKSKLSIAVPSLPKEEKQHMQQRMDEGKTSVDSSGVFSVVTPFRRSSDQAYFTVAATPDQLRNLDRRGLFRPVATFEKVK